MSAAKSEVNGSAARRVALPITGMTCAACAALIERRLSKSPGVAAANVNFATARATVEYDPRRTGLRALRERVEELGYRAGEEHGRQRWRQGYELKEVVRELTLLRATLIEFLERYRGALPLSPPEELARSFNKINLYMDDEIYKTVEAYLDASHNPQSN